MRFKLKHNKDIFYHMSQQIQKHKSTYNTQSSYDFYI